MGRTPSTLSNALRELSERPTPALVWRDGQERVELSGRVLVNWVEKTAGLLVDELDVETGALITVSPRPHWRLTVIALAALRVGATLRFTPDSHPDAVVHAELEAHLDTAVPAEHLLAVATPALAFACETPAPEGALDFCAEVRSFPDSYLGMEEPQPADTALTASGITHADLVARAVDAASRVADPTVYVLLTDGWDEDLLLVTLGVLIRGGTVLLAASGQDVDPHVLAQEHAVELPDAASSS